MKWLPNLLLVFIQFLWLPVMAQQKTALLSGKVLDQEDQPIAGVTIAVLGKNIITVTNDTGFFQITLTAGRATGLVFTHTGYAALQRNFLLNSGEEEFVLIRMQPGTKELTEVTVTDDRNRREAGLITINPKNALSLPSPTGGIESLIKVFVGSNNELTSNYNVRGGSYDENLIYINDFEIFRPYLVRNGQQEGLSFINPELTRTVQFYNGGFQARYGDKLSSVLDIQYKKPKQHGGSAYIGLLEQGIQVEGSSRKLPFTYLIGVRNRNNRNLLSKQETSGNYVPSSADVQALFTLQLNEKWSAELFGNLSRTRFSLQPAFSQPSTSVFSPYFSSNIGLDIYFDGREKDRYSTSMAGISITKQVNKNFRLKWLSSYFQNNEAEAIDITGAYLFGERSFDRTKPEFGLIVNPLGAGIFQQYARNELKIGVFNFSHKATLTAGQHYHQWGISFDRQEIRDKLREFEYQDSAGYSLPYQPGNLSLFKSLNSAADLTIHRISAYWQDNISLGDSSGTILQLGARVNYNDLNKEWLISPRAGISWKPSRWQRDIIFRASAGIYMQPAFYRELRRYDGSLNTDIRAQKSWQVSGGFDYHFPAFNQVLRLSTELYFKNLWDVVPYDIDNVRLRYFGENMARAYAAGIETRIYGELVKDAESYFSIGFMRTREDLENDNYFRYTLDDQNRPVDSSLVQNGYLRRPTDRLITLGMFFQDYLSTNKNIKVYINGIYGSNLPYNIPNSVRYRNALFIDPYIRIDLGFSAQLMNADRSRRRRHAPFREFENIWLSLEVFNLIDRANTISYLLIKDFSNTTYAIPNRLTPRLLNLKLVTRW